MCVCGCGCEGGAVSIEGFKPSAYYILEKASPFSRTRFRNEYLQTRYEDERKNINKQDFCACQVKLNKPPQQLCQ